MIQIVIYTHRGVARHQLIFGKLQLRQLHLFVMALEMEHFVQAIAAYNR